MIDQKWLKSNAQKIKRFHSKEVRLQNGDTRITAVVLLKKK